MFFHEVILSRVSFQRTENVAMARLKGVFGKLCWLKINAKDFSLHINPVLEITVYFYFKPFSRCDEQKQWKYIDSL